MKRLTRILVVAECGAEPCRCLTENVRPHGKQRLACDAQSQSAACLSRVWLRQACWRPPPRLLQPWCSTTSNRPNGGLGANWAARAAATRSKNNSVTVGDGGPAYWCQGGTLSKFGVDQEAFITINVRRRERFEQDVLLKVQGGSTPDYARVKSKSCMTP